MTKNDIRSIRLKAPETAQLVSSAAQIVYSLLQCVRELAENPRSNTNRVKGEQTTSSIMYKHHTETVDFMYLCSKFSRLIA